MPPSLVTLSASGAPAVAAAQLAHFFFESLHAFCQPVEALVDPLPVALFVLAATAPGASRIRASLVGTPGSASPAGPPELATTYFAELFFFLRRW